MQKRQSSKQNYHLCLKETPQIGHLKGEDYQDLAQRQLQFLCHFQTPQKLEHSHNIFVLLVRFR